MSDNKATFRHATSEGVNIRLDGKIVTLRYTLGASRKVDAIFGNFTEAMRRISTFNFDAYVQVVTLGLGSEASISDESVWKAGQDDLCQPLTEYLIWLSNGGRAPTPLLEQKAASGGNV